MLREYPTLKRLRAGEIVDLGGLVVKMDEGEIRPGDLYVGERNTGPQLLTAKLVHESGYIIPTTFQYAYDIGECVKVKEV